MINRSHYGGVERARTWLTPSAVWPWENHSLLGASVSQSVSVLPREGMRRWELSLNDSSHDSPREVSSQGQSVGERDWDPALLTSRPVCCLTLFIDPENLGLWHWRCGEGAQLGWRDPTPQKPESKLPSTPSRACPQGGSKDSSVKAPAGKRR